MLFLVAALLLFGTVLGTVAHAPLSFTLVAGLVVAAWLGIFAARERHGRRRGTSTS
jgi:predicted membrane metal-binding protein